ncbi:IS630 family transposase [Crenothrix polyspora]
MKKKYIVRLTEDERDYLDGIIHTGKVAAHKRLHAEILLKADISESGGKWQDGQISEAFGISTRTVERVRERLVQEGLEPALNRAKREPARSRVIDGEKEAHLIALACGDAPEGYSRWTLRMLGEHMVELGHVESVSHETIRRAPKKNELKPWQKKEWCIPTSENADFVCAMEDVLGVYKRTYDETHPLICMDESSKQHIDEVRQPIAAKPGTVEKYDTEYERNGVSNMFMFFNPLEGKRHVEVTDQRTAVDWAQQIKDLVDVKYPHAKRITLVMDNLNTHTGASLYKAFVPEEARRILDRLEIHYTPKHGSWLNMAEIELSILSRQCLDQRIPDQDTLKKEIAAWQEKRNALAQPMEWRFTNEDARIKLKKLYPTLKE